MTVEARLLSEIPKKTISLGNPSIPPCVTNLHLQLNWFVLKWYGTKCYKEKMVLDKMVLKQYYGTDKMVRTKWYR